MAKKKKVPGKIGKNRGLMMMNFQVPPALYRQFRVKTIRERVTVRAVAEAFLIAYVKGDFQLVEEKKADPKG